MQTEAILALMTRLRESMPRAAAPRPSDPPDTTRPLDVEDFDYETVLYAVQSVAADLSAMIDTALADVTAKALDVYRTAEELARDPANAHLVPYVEAMRQAYEREYGRG